MKRYKDVQINTEKVNEAEENSEESVDDTDDDETIE